MSCCYIRRTEAGCPVPPITDPTGGTVTVPTVQGLWFECAIPGGGCHHGIGFVRMYNGNGVLMYHGCPTTTGTNRTFITFDASLLNYGSRLHVDYIGTRTDLREGLAAACCCNHGCNSGIFRAGLGDHVIGTANINNAGQDGANDGNGPGGARYNRFSIPNNVIDDFLGDIGGNPDDPTTPSGVAATYMNQQRIVLVWNDLSTAETGYEIERSINFGAWSTITTTPANTALYADTNPPGGAFGYNTRVAYRVREVRASGTYPWAEAVVTTPLPPDPSSRQVCWLETDVCTGWIEAISNPVAAVNYVPVGYTFATVPAGGTFRIALINYATRGSASTSAGAQLEVHLNGSVVATYPFSLASNGSPLSPFPFDGFSIDGVPFSIANIWGAPVQIKAAGGVPGFPGIYFDDSAAYQIVGAGVTGGGAAVAGGIVDDSRLIRRGTIPWTRPLPLPS